MNSKFWIIIIGGIFLAIIVSIQYYFLKKILRYIRLNQKSSLFRTIVLSVFTLFVVPLIVLMIWQPKLGRAPDWVIAFCIFPLYIWHFSFSMLFLTIIIGKAIQLPFRCVAWVMKKFETTKIWLLGRNVQRFDTKRRVFLQHGITILAGAALTSSTIGAFRRNEFKISYVTVPIASLPDEYVGFTISLLSDIHSSAFMTKETMSRYAKATNELKSDIITVVGDFVNSQADEVYPFAEAFSELKSPYGVYGVLGNHDYYTRNVDVVAKQVDECGIRLLVNERLYLEKDSQKLWILGVDDVGNTTKADQLIDKLAHGISEATPKLLLCHRPYYFEQAANRNINLTLSGHTHGGQIVFAKLGKDIYSFARIASPYVAGMYTIGSSHMYVSRGIGTVGVPVRINCPPEITKITLVKA